MMRTPRSLARALLAAALSTTLALPATAQDRREAVMFERDFPVDAGATLAAVVGDMDLDVRTADVARAHVRVIARARDLDFARDEFDLLRFTAGTNGGGLRIETRELNRNWSLREWREHGGVSFRAEITLPRRFDLDLRTGDGDIRIGEVAGDVSLDTGDGDIWIDGATGSRMAFHTGDGDVTVRRLEADDIELRTGDGDLVLERISGAFTATTGDGDVELDIERFAGATIRTGDGDVTVRADPSLRAELDIEGEDVEVSRPFQVTGRLSRRHLSGTLNGGGPRLSVRTGDGSVSLRSR